MSDKEEMMQDDEFSPDELIVRKKKTPEMRTGVTPESVLKTTADALASLREKKGCHIHFPVSWTFSIQLESSVS